LRRILAISLLLIFGLPLFAPLSGWSEASADTPACCRRDGKHHCAMDGSSSRQKQQVTIVAEKCPCSPASLASVTVLPFTPSAASAIFAGIAKHPATHPQVEARYRVSFDRSRLKRGPPASSLL